MGHWLAVDECFPGHRRGRAQARAYATRRLEWLEGIYPHPAEVDAAVVACPGHDGCTLREDPTMRRSA